MPRRRPFSAHPSISAAAPPRVERMVRSATQQPAAAAVATTVPAALPRTSDRRDRRHVVLDRTAAAAADSEEEEEADRVRALSWPRAQRACCVERDTSGTTTQQWTMEYACGSRSHWDVFLALLGDVPVEVRGTTTGLCH